MPLTFTKPVASLRMGVLTFTERWERLLNTTVSYKTVPYLVDKFPINLQSENIFINPSFFPSKKLVETINSLIIGQSIVYNNELVAVKTVENEPTITVDSIIFEEELIHIKHSWDLFSYNFQAIEFDFELLTAGKTSQPISSTNRVLHPEKNIFRRRCKSRICNP